MFLVTSIIIFINLTTHTWIAYDYNNLQVVKTGIALGGTGICKETGRPNCFTPTGIFSIYAKYPMKRSDKYPVECQNKKLCGARMWWFQKWGPKGEGIHASDIQFPIVPKNISHGCVRLTKEDALWLYQHTTIGTMVFISK